MTKSHRRQGGWMVRVVLTRQAGEAVVTAGDLAGLRDALTLHQPIIFSKGDTYTAELFLDDTPRDAVGDRAIQLVEDGLRQAALPLWSVADITMWEAEPPSCMETDSCS